MKQRSFPDQPGQLNDYQKAIIAERTMVILRANGGEMKVADLKREMVARGWANEDFLENDALDDTDVVRIKNPMKRMQ